MVCITMDAHSRDIVEKLYREKVTDVTCFQWQAQVRTEGTAAMFENGGDEKMRTVMLMVMVTMTRLSETRQIFGALANVCTLVLCSCCS
jgi:hypothetical protein